MSLSEKLGVSKCYTYTRIGELAYQNCGTGSWNYCTQICSKAINAGACGTGIFYKIYILIVSQIFVRLLLAKKL